MNIEWTDDHPYAAWSSMSGIDEDGNLYFMNACREVVTVTTPDGRHGLGWTAEEALRSALKQEVRHGA